MQTSIVRLQPVRIDHPYLISRNLSGDHFDEKSLEHKRIILAGCGAIGGYLAEMLARAGAGSGAGRLILVDPEYLVPGNLGRHVLGVQYLFRNKAEAVRDWVCSRFPSAAVVAISEDAVADAQRFYVSAAGVVLVTPEMLGQELHHVR